MGDVFLRMGQPKQAQDEYEESRKAAEQILALHPFILDAQYVLAGAYGGLGRLSETLAYNRRSSQGNQLQDWTEAQHWYRQSLNSWQRIADPGERTPTGLACGNPTKIARSLARVKVAILKLKQTVTAGAEKS